MSDKEKLRKLLLSNEFKNSTIDRQWANMLINEVRKLGLEELYIKIIEGRILKQSNESKN